MVVRFNPKAMLISLTIDDSLESLHIRIRFEIEINAWHCFNAIMQQCFSCLPCSDVFHAYLYRIVEPALSNARKPLAACLTKYMPRARPGHSNALKCLWLKVNKLKSNPPRLPFAFQTSLGFRLLFQLQLGPCMSFLYVHNFTVRDRHHNHIRSNLWPPFCRSACLTQRILHDNMSL